MTVPAERYVDRHELAALMGVSPTTIKRMVAAGMPSETWGMKRTRRFLPSQAMAWAREFHRDYTPPLNTATALGTRRPATTTPKE